MIYWFINDCIFLKKIYCDLSNYRSLPNSFNKYDFFAENSKLYFDKRQLELS